MKRYIISVILLLSISNIYAQTETLIFKNCIIVVGEVKSMNMGVISIEADYSDSDLVEGASENDCVFQTTFEWES